MLPSLKEFGYLFYLVNPKEAVVENVHSVPDYITEAIPYFVFMTFIEQVIIFIKGLKIMRVNDTVTSIAQGIIMEQSKVLARSLTIIYYIYAHEKWKLVSMDWSIASNWILALILVDLLYYWFHRASHEINFFWATHNVHHSSEEYNLSTALRQTIFQLYLQSFFYIPLALIVPPPVFMVHIQLNTLYQFWIHTELIKNLGPLEWIFNTPSHHRVHHGRNRYCIDKNYGSVLIIWDRMFGTFQAEDEQVVYGLIHPLNSFNPFTVQCHHYVYMFKKLLETKGFKNKLSILFKGPGWEEGKPRLGLIEDIPEVNEDIIKYDPVTTMVEKVYVTWHFALIIFFHVQIMENCETFSWLTAWTSVIFIFLSLTSLGLNLDAKSSGPKVELFRCLFFFIFDYIVSPSFIKIQSSSLGIYIFPLVRLCFVCSILYLSLCFFMSIHDMKLVLKLKKQK